MSPAEYPVVGVFANDTTHPMTLYLEMVPEEVVLSPGHSVELLARPTADLLPLTIDEVDGGLHIHACREFDPDWHIRFRGHLIKAGALTVLKDFECREPPPTPPPAARSLWQDRWLLGALLVLLALYAYLLQLRPGGEGFGRGWNMIAFLFYGSPPAVAAGAIALWRVGKTAGLLRRVAILGATLGLSFPIVAILLMRLRT